MLHIGLRKHVERTIPRLQRLARNTIYKINTDIGDSAGFQQRYCVERFASRVTPPHESQVIVIQTLHPHAHPVHAQFSQRLHQFTIHVVRVYLYRKFLYLIQIQDLS